MLRNRAKPHRSGPVSSRKRAIRPVPEMLEGRLLLYSKLGDQFVYSSRITYSFMPDGTSVGGVPSSLFATLNANYPTATWETQIEQAASIWEAAANLNLSLVPDGGEAEGAAGNQQDDPRFGDIRIGAVPLGAGTLAVTFLPPPANGGTDSGDILLNSSINWQINSNYDLMTVMAHEFGHALGLGDVSTPTNPYPVMYGTYEGINQALTADDTAGIQAVDGVRQFDVYNTGGKRNLSYTTAANITGNFNTSAQAAIPGLDITTGGDSEWFYFTVPSNTTGDMTVSVQSSNLSSLSPKLMLYNSSLSLVGEALAPNSMGATVTVSTAVAANQGYYVKVLAAPGYGAIGGYGLLINAGPLSQAPIPPPDTVVLQQPDQGAGGSLTNAVGAGNDTDALPPNAVFTTIGTLGGWAEVLTVPPAAPVNPPVNAPTSLPPASPIPVAPTAITVAPAPSPVAVVAPPTASKHHHAKPKHVKMPRFAVGQRIKLVNDHAKPKHHDL
jgi:Matrixin